jgi:hypothetical protein
MAYTSRLGDPLSPEFESRLEIAQVRRYSIRGLVSLLHNLESDLKTHVSVDHVVRKC